MRRVFVSVFDAKLGLCALFGIPQRLYQVISGSLDVVRTNEAGRSIRLAQMLPGTTFGELSFLNQTDGATATVVASSNSEVFVFEGVFLQCLFGARKPLARFVAAFYILFFHVTHFLMQMCRKI